MYKMWLYYLKVRGLESSLKKGEKAMEIDQNSWHAKLYFWCLSIWARFKSGDHSERYYWRFSQKTNLCLYIRSIVIWMPLVVLLHLLLLVYAIGVLSIPLFTFGWGYIYFLASIVIATAGIYLWVRYLHEKPKSELDYQKLYKEREEKERKRERKMALKANKPPSFTEVLIEWIKAKKSAICPIIDFSGQAKEESHEN